MGSGPSNPEPRVLQALAAWPLAPEGKEVETLRVDLEREIKAVFQADTRSAGPGGGDADLGGPPRAESGSARLGGGDAGAPGGHRAASANAPPGGGDAGAPGGHRTASANAPPGGGDDDADGFDVENACALAVAGASRAGLEAVIASAVEPGDGVLVGVYGHFGELLCTLAARHGALVERVDATWGEIVELEALQQAIRERRPKLVAIVHADTSTGIVQPLDGLGAACREAGALLLVDAVLSLGGYEFDFDAWQVDAAVAGLQKCLGGPPGLALVTFGDRARTCFEQRTRPTQSASLDLARLNACWRDRGLDSSVPQMLFAAREALRIVLEEGLEPRWQRHARASNALRKGIEAMGLPLFADPQHRVPMITLVTVPDGVDEAGVRAQLLEQHGIEIMAAFGPLRGRVWRIGTMGTNAAQPSVLAVLAGLEAVLASRGVKLPRGAAVDAALAAYGSDST